MSSATYEQALADREYLWEEYGPAEDMTGGYVDQDDLERLLKSPTKATARRCLEDQIAYWFNVGPDTFHGNSASGRGRAPDRDDERLQEIADRYGCEIP